MYVFIHWQFASMWGGEYFIETTKYKHGLADVFYHKGRRIILNGIWFTVCTFSWNHNLEQLLSSLIEPHVIEQIKQ